MTNVEGKFGLRTRDAKPGDTLNPRMLTRSIHFCLAKEKGHRVHEIDVSSAVVLIFNETTLHAMATASNIQRCQRSQKVRTKVRARELISQAFEHPKSKTNSEIQEPAQRYHQ